MSLDASEKFQLQLKHWFSIICCFVGRIHLTTEMSLTGLWLFTGCTESTGGSCKHWGLKVQSLPKAKGILTSSSGKPAGTLGVWYDRERLMIVKSKNKCSHFKHLAQWNTFTTTQPEAPNDQLVKGIKISYVLLMESQNLKIQTSLLLVNGFYQNMTLQIHYSDIQELLKALQWSF